MVTTIYDQLEKEHGAVLAGRSLAYLVASRGTNGLAEDEMLDALSRDEDVLREFTARARHTPPEPRLPAVVWSRLFFDLEPYLSMRTSEGVYVLTFYHRELAVVASARYLAQDPLARHAGPAAYSMTLLIPTATARGRPPPRLRRTASPSERRPGLGRCLQSADRSALPWGKRP